MKHLSTVFASDFSLFFSLFLPVKSSFLGSPQGRGCQLGSHGRAFQKTKLKRRGISSCQFSERSVWGGTLVEEKRDLERKRKL